MNKVKRRAMSALLVAVLVLGGIGVYIVRYIEHGAEWATFAANSSVYTSGVLNTGTLTDRSGVVLATASGGSRSYAEDAAVRKACYQTVGDYAGNIGTGALKAFSKQLSGYNPITGTALGSHDVHLTLDASLNETAYAALNGHKGVVAVYDYTTGDIKCLVSSPSYDPNNPPSDVNENSAYEGVYLNRFFSSTYPPGSVFKIITTAAAIEEKDDLDQFRYTCTGSLEVGGDVITCPYAHGADMDINQCLACSCNGAYATLAMELGGSTLAKYVEQAGLLDSLNVNGISTASGSFVAEEDGSAYLGWSGVGQDKDLVNPCSLLAFMGSIANEGEAVVPNLVGSETIGGTAIPAALPDGKDTYETYSAETCQRLKEMMRNNVVTEYGQSQFGDLAVCAKSGTAEVGGGAEPHAWFAGFIDDPDHPLAFVVLVENGSAGARVAGSVAAQVLAQATAE